VTTGLLRYGPEEIEYSVVENARLMSRVRIHVNPDGRVEVERPRGVGSEEVQRAVQKRSRWIVRNVKRAGAATEYALPRRYVSGEAHFYLGRRHKLIVMEAGEGPSEISLRRGRIEVCLPVADPAAVRRRLRRWYRARASSYFSRKLGELVARFEGIDSAPPFQLLAMEKRWGSCSPSGQISLNPSLIKAPVQCVEYVLTHELCHLLEHNHSKRFYALLDRQRPEWRMQKRELDALAEQLLVD
jgi:predicted metal-dependent hydrolase